MAAPRTSRIEFPPTRRALVRIALVFIGVFCLVLAGHGVLEMALTPWARSFGLWRTLTGEWYGALRRPDGQSVPLYVALTGGLRITRGGGTDRTYIEGRARVCDGPAVIRDYTLHGRPDGWRGRSFSLGTALITEPPPPMRLGDLVGEWTDDTLRLAGAEVSTAMTQTAEATRSSPPPPTSSARFELVPVHELRRGTEAEFLAACR
jgi:hypothetical protein